MTAQKQSFWLVLATVVVTAILSVMPLPETLAFFRPAWVALAIIFWVLMQPTTFGLFFAWMNGILLDVLYGTVFGQHAMALIFVAMAVIQLEKRLRVSIWWQQSALVLMIIGLYQLIVLWIGSATGHVTPGFAYLLPAVSSAVVWPWMVAFLQALRRRFVII